MKTIRMVKGEHSVVIEPGQFAEFKAAGFIPAADPGQGRLEAPGPRRKAKPEPEAAAPAETETPAEV
jgi:hypothetical protein